METALQVFLLLVSPVSPATIRLSGGGSCTGRVEVYNSSQWGTVCDDDWDINDATVVCRELGCGAATAAPHKAHFGQGSGNIWLDNVACTGTESSLSNCGSNDWGDHDCKHEEDASVICDEKPGSPVSATIRLSGGSSCTGRVEVYYSGQWGTVCDDDWDINDATVVCRELGCEAATTAPHKAHFGQGSGNIWLDNVTCTGIESSLSHCGSSVWGDHDCDHGEDASVICDEKPVIEEKPISQDVVRVSIMMNADVDPNSPIIQKMILDEIRNQLGNGRYILKWKMESDGLIFHHRETADK